MVLQIKFDFTSFLFPFLLLFFFLSPTIGICSSTITIDSDIQYRYALELFEEQNFETAIVELNRFIYFFPDDQRSKDAIFKKGVSLFCIKRYIDAVKVFKELASTGANDPLNIDNCSDVDNCPVAEAFFMLSTTFLAMDKEGSAEMVLQELLLLNDNPKIEDRALYALSGIYLSRAQKQQTSQKEADQVIMRAIEYIDRMTPEGKEKYNYAGLKKDIYKGIDTIEQKKKSPLLAGIASVVPGGGFAYCNRYHDAFMAFLLNTAFVLAAAESFEDGNGALGGLIGFVGFGFYGGSIYGGISSAHKHNKNITRDSVDNIKQMHPGIGSDTFSCQGRQESSCIEMMPAVDDDREKKSSKIPLLSIKIPF